jgi:DNA mismatch endonuclease (patch repair protein)
MGYRYRVDVAPLAALRRRADIVFTRARVAVFVDGCFWHGCPDCDLRPKANAAWWREKLDRNRARDADTDTQLVRAGWAVVRVWEHEDLEASARRVADIVVQRRLAARR